MSAVVTDNEMDSSTLPITHDHRDINGIIYEPKSPQQSRPTASKKTALLSLLLAVGGITCCIVGVVFFERAKRLSMENRSTHENSVPVTCSTENYTRQVGPCELSEEVQTSGLIQFFAKVEETYFSLNPQDIPYKWRIPPEKILEKFQAYNPTPSAIKMISDTSAALLKELKTMKYRKEFLKPREAKALAKVVHFLEHNFGNPFDNGYYTGEWMLGPSRFCYMQAFYKIPNTFRYYLHRTLYTPSNNTIADIERLIKVLENHRVGINQYRKNIQMGVEVGMVNSVEECRVGYDCLANQFDYIPTTHLAEDILHETFFIRILISLSNRFENATKEWQQKYGKSLITSLQDAMVVNLGEPLAQLFRYLLVEHRRHCVPSSVSSGLGTRPVSYVYYDGVANRSQPTTKTLPTGEKANGKKAYERILKFFTTTDATPDDVHKIGWDTLNSLYPELIRIAKKITNEANETTAVTKFRKYINSSAMYFNQEPFPANESDDVAHRMCKTLKTAKMYCPVRYAALSKWVVYAQSALSMLQPKLINLFHWLISPKKTTPICPVSMAANFFPSSGAQSYSAHAGSHCKRTSEYYVPFFLDRMGPKYSEWSVNAHEAMPGHHLQLQGYTENFRDTCNPLLGALYLSKYSNTAFIEGWALYAEYPLIAEDTDVYRDSPLHRYGMLKWQIWRALRLIVDTGLHYKGMTRQEALQLFSKYAWDDSDVAKKEVTRYQSGPGQATAYMMGQRSIMSMRDKAMKRLGHKFKLKDFHYYILSHGPRPLSFVEHQIDRYIACENDEAGPGCEHIIVNSTSAHTLLKAKNHEPTFEETLDLPEIHEF